MGASRASIPAEQHFSDLFVLPQGLEMDRDSEPAEGERMAGIRPSITPRPMLGFAPPGSRGLPSRPLAGLDTPRGSQAPPAWLAGRKPPGRTRNRSCPTTDPSNARRRRNPKSRFKQYCWNSVRHSRHRAMSDVEVRAFTMEQDLALVTIAEPEVGVLSIGNEGCPLLCQPGEVTEAICWT